MYATGGGEAHEVELLAVVTGIAVSLHNLRVLEDVAALAGLVDLYEVLIDNASGTDVEVSHLGVTHLTVRKTNVLARGLEPRLRSDNQEMVLGCCR